MRFATREKVTNKKEALEIEERGNLCARFAIRFAPSPERFLDKQVESGEFR